jgi:DNA-binding IclR family transcriptional regulator
MVAVDAGALINECRRAHAHLEVTQGARVIELVASNPGSTASDVARALGLNRNSVANRLAQLAESGELSKAKRA